MAAASISGGATWRRGVEDDGDEHVPFGELMATLGKARRPRGSQCDDGQTDAPVGPRRASFGRLLGNRTSSGAWTHNVHDVIAAPPWLQTADSKEPACCATATVGSRAIVATTASIAAASPATSRPTSSSSAPAPLVTSSGNTPSTPSRKRSWVPSCATRPPRASRASASENRDAQEKKQTDNEAASARASARELRKLGYSIHPKPFASQDTTRGLFSRIAPLHQRDLTAWEQEKACMPERSWSTSATTCVVNGVAARKRRNSGSGGGGGHGVATASPAWSGGFSSASTAPRERSRSPEAEKRLVPVPAGAVETNARGLPADATAVAATAVATSSRPSPALRRSLTPHRSDGRRGSGGRGEGLSVAFVIAAAASDDNDLGDEELNEREHALQMEHMRLHRLRLIKELRRTDKQLQRIKPTQDRELVGAAQRGSTPSSGIQAPGGRPRILRTSASSPSGSVSFADPYAAGGG
eukprot:TRINITY_DN42258_c0_g1_i1.p1 TRINITY_DN42258_c0_g1~~TRINITY_DN42258_c0_g1_i1.p1  ORF type:complete len:489 (+),score=92.34 TRINITY_DN42258_c0_g1_i1:57-1469(+)